MNRLAPILHVLGLVILIFSFTLLAALNFVTHFLAFRQRSLTAYRHDPEVRGVLGLVIASCRCISPPLWR